MSEDDIKLEALFGYKTLRPEMPVTITDIGDGFDCFVGRGPFGSYYSSSSGYSIATGIAIGVAIGCS